MNPRIKDVKPLDNFMLDLYFENGEHRVFDMKNYLDKGVFRELKNKAKFYAVRPCLGSIVWQNGQDLCPDTLYLESKSA